MSRTQRSLQIAAYADGEIAPAHRAAAEAEIAASSEAQREVASVTSLRAALHRAFVENSAPHSLAETIRAKVRADRRRATGRAWRIGLASTFAAAAVVMLAVRVVGPDIWSDQADRVPPMAARSVAIGDVLRVHLDCTVGGEKPHDVFRVAQRPAADANRLLRNLRKMPQADATLTDLSSLGYSLASACKCSPEKDCDVIRAAYANARGTSISMWISDRPLVLSIAAGEQRITRASGKREYEAVGIPGGYSVVRWDEKLSSVSIVLCGNLSVDELIKVADSIQPFTSAGRLGGPRVALLDRGLERFEPKL